MPIVLRSIKGSPLTSNEVDGNFEYLVNSKQDALTFDSTPTASSSNPVTSNGIKAYVDDAVKDVFYKDGSVKATGDFDLDGNKIINLGTPTNDNDAATKKYVDDSIDIFPERFINKPYYFTDFYTTTDWSAINANGGGNGISGAGTGDLSLYTAITGTASNGRGGIVLANSANTSMVHYLGQCEFTFINKIIIPTLSTATDEFDVIYGLNDNPGGDAVDGVYFLYRRASHGDFWVCVTASNNTRETTVTTTPVTTNAVMLKAVVNAAGTEVKFYIDSGSGFVLVATNTTNIPVGSNRGLTAQFSIQKTAGTTQMAIRTDFWLHYLNGLARI